MEKKVISKFILALFILSSGVKSSVKFEVEPTTGYIDIFPEDQNGKNRMFYWLFNPENGNKKAPLVIYINGGPGCASTRGAFTHVGPISVHKYNKDKKIAAKNPYGWNKKNYLLFIDQPIGVGFSTSTSERESREKGELKRQFMKFISRFFDSNPEFKGTDLYLSSICYGGQYGAYFSKALKESEQAGLYNFKGFFVTNPIIDPMTYFTAMVDYSYQMREHTMMSDGLKAHLDKIIEECKHRYSLGFKNPMHAYTTVAACSKPKGIIHHIASKYNPNFNLFYLRNRRNVTLSKEHIEFLNDPEVQEHIGVDKKYNDCNYKWGYMFAETDMMQDASEYYEYLLDNGVKVWIVSGEDDWETNYYQIEEDLAKLDWSGTDLWKGNDLRECTYGMCKRVKNLNYVRMEDGIHVITMSNPQESLELFYNFLEE